MAPYANHIQYITCAYNSIKSAKVNGEMANDEEKKRIIRVFLSMKWRQRTSKNRKNRRKISPVASVTEAATL